MLFVNRGSLVVVAQRVVFHILLIREKLEKMTDVELIKSIIALT